MVSNGKNIIKRLLFNTILFGVLVSLLVAYMEVFGSAVLGALNGNLVDIVFLVIFVFVVIRKTYGDVKEGIEDE